jgi:hypothetical protein
MVLSGSRYDVVTGYFEKYNSDLDNILTTWVTPSFSEKTELCGVSCYIVKKIRMWKLRVTVTLL